MVTNLFSIHSDRDSSVGIATRYGLDNPGIEAHCGARFSPPVQTDPGAHPLSYTMVIATLTGGVGVKQLMRCVALITHPPPYRAEVKERV